MRSSLGAPHSTERCKITNFSQRIQIFSAFSIEIGLFTCICQDNVCSIRVLISSSVILSSNPRLGIEPVLHFSELELQDVVGCHRSKSLSCAYLLSSAYAHGAQVAVD